MNKQYDTEEEYLKHYKPGDYARPSVTADILLFTLDEAGTASLPGLLGSAGRLRGDR